LLLTPMIMSPFVITCGCTTHHEPHGANGATCKSGGRIKVDSNMMSKKHKHALGLQCSQHAMTCPALCTALPCPVHCPALPCALPCPTIFCYLLSAVLLVWRLLMLSMVVQLCILQHQQNRMPCAAASASHKMLSRLSMSMRLQL